MNLVSPIPGLVKEPAFPEAEYRARLARLWDVMRESRLDAMLIHHPATVFYFAGNENLHVYDNECVVAPVDGEPTLVVPRIDETRACLTSWTDRIVSVTSDEDAPDVLAGVLREAGVARGQIGVEKRVARAAGLSVHVFEGLQAALPGATLVDASGVPERVKLVKSEREIAYLREAGRLTDLGVRAALAVAAEGRADYEIAAAAYQAMIGAGSDFLAIPAIVNCGPYSGITHSTHVGRRLARGDVLFLELGACRRRYSSPCVRTASVGPPGPDVRRLAEASEAAVAGMHAVMRAGATCDEVARAGAAGVARAGTGVRWSGDYGYPVGAGFPPHWGDYSCGIRLGNSMELQAGMVFHQPVSLRIPGRVGVGFSDTVLITATGCERLTGTPRTLVTL
jgi:Xaa-Pro aminopeptidase